MTAYESLQSLKCPECGEWLWKCSSEVKGTEHISYNISESFCRRTRAFNGYMDAKRDSKERANPKDKAQWGAVHRIEPIVDPIYSKDGIEMPTYADYLEQQKLNYLK